VLARIQHDGLLQSGAEALPELSQSTQIFSTDPRAGLDLEGDHLAVVAF
jgi:hypothetical protein